MDSHDTTALEKTVSSQDFVRPLANRDKQQQRESQVCLLVIPTKDGKTEHGTGFLIGPDTVLTAFHVIERLDPSKPALAIFDYAEEQDEHSIKAERVPLTDNAVFYQAPYSSSDLDDDSETLPDVGELDFALVRLSKPVGRERGWIVFPDKPIKSSSEPTIHILQHPEGAPQRLDSNVICGENSNKTRLVYRTNTKKGSSGSPCFNTQWDLVAHHHSSTDEGNQGIPAFLVREHLKEKAVWAQISADEAQPAHSLIPEEEVKEEATLSPLAYAVLSGVGLLIGIGILCVILFNGSKLQALGWGEKAFYILLLPMALGCAAFLFGAMRSLAGWKGTILRGQLQLGGPVIAFILVMLGGVKLVPGAQDFSFTLLLETDYPEAAALVGSAYLDLGGERKEEAIDAKGTVTFKNIPTRFRDQEVEFGIRIENHHLPTQNRTIHLGSESARILLSHEHLGRIRGRIFSPDGTTGVSGAKIMVGNQNTKSDSNGLFELSIPPKEQKAKPDIFITHPDYLPYENPIDTRAGESLQIVLHSRD